MPNASADITVIEDDPRQLAALEQAVQNALDEARRLGASSAEASMSTSTGQVVTVRLGEVETIEYTRDQGLGVTVYFGGRKGSASTTDIGNTAIADTVSAACSIARHTSEDDCAGLADAELMATEVLDLDLYHPWPIDADAAVDIALETEQAARDVDERITNSDGATVNHHVGNQVYGNSHGFLGGHASSRHGLSCVVIAEDGDGMQRDYWYTTARSADELETSTAVGAKAGERSVRRLGARKIPTQEAPAIFSAEMASSLFRHFISAISGGNLYRQSSFLLDSAGEHLFPEFVRIHEQPHLPRAMGSASYDAEGVRTAPRDLVTGGVLQGYVLGSYSARKLGLTTTANAGGVHNLTIDPGPQTQDLEAMMATMGSGLLVTELMGMGINITTGDYSRGAAGYWVENGEIAHPVEEITIASNLRDMFQGVRQIGTDVDRRGNLRVGSVLLEKMTIAGD